MAKLFAYHQFENVLDQGTLAELVDFTLTNEANYTLSNVARVGEKVIDTTSRYSLTLLKPSKFKHVFIEKLTALSDDIFYHLNMSRFKISKFEFQLSAHGNGAFFKQHIDTISHQSTGKSSRVISAVFYYHLTPKEFEGGELVIYPLPFLPGDDQPVVINPMNNKLVVFPSVAPHEVLPVTLQKSDFSKYRFSVNCWLHK